MFIGGNLNVCGTYVERMWDVCETYVERNCKLVIPGKPDRS